MVSNCRRQHRFQIDQQGGVADIPPRRGHTRRPSWPWRRTRQEFGRCNAQVFRVHRESSTKTWALASPSRHRQTQSAFRNFQMRAWASIVDAGGHNNRCHAGANLLPGIEARRQVIRRSRRIPPPDAPGSPCTKLRNGPPRDSASCCHGCICQYFDGGGP